MSRVLRLPPNLLRLQLQYADRNMGVAHHNNVLLLVIILQEYLVEKGDHKIPKPIPMTLLGTLSFL